MKRWICALLLLCLLTMLSACGGNETPAVSLFCLDVGQASCFLIRTPEGDVLVDAGSEASEERLLPRLRELGVRRLALAVFTHADEDHIGGGDAVLGGFDVDLVWYNGEEYETESMRRLSRVMYERGIPVERATAGKGFSIGKLLLTVLSPKEMTEGNNGSLVLRLCYGSFTALLMGDAEERVEKELLADYGEAQLRSQLLLVGHHGSNSACCEEFLRAVMPRWAAVSCGEGNAYGNPDGRVLDRLGDVDAEIRRTDLEGELCWKLSEDGSVIGVIAEKNGG